MPKAIAIDKKGDYYPLSLRDVPESTPQQEELIVEFTAAALNHRDLFIRQNLYHGISFESPLLADGVGIVLSPPASAPSTGRSLPVRPGDRVLVNPGTGWVRDLDGPEQAFAVIGGSRETPLGTLQERGAFPIADLAPAPPHLSDVEAAALPLAGLTAWRALVTKSGNAQPGRNILVTGIGGGVALMALQLGVAHECRVFVSSSSPEKLSRAEKLGAAGGVLYTEPDWAKQLQAKLPKDRPFLDAVIDGNGGDVVKSTQRLLKPGGVVVCYGQTSLTAPALPMPAVLKNIELKGSTMGSRHEFQQMVRFVAEKQIRPVVERVVAPAVAAGGGRQAIDGLYEDMKHGKQFGKLVIQIKPSPSEHEHQHKL